LFFSNHFPIIYLTTSKNLTGTQAQFSLFVKQVNLQSKTPFEEGKQTAPLWMTDAYIRSSELLVKPC